jgi:hypothetical protein
MPPKASRGGKSNQNRGTIQSYFKVPDSVLGKRGHPDEREEDKDVANPLHMKKYEPQSSFANFMNKKGDVIQRMLQEKGINEIDDEPPYHEHFSFKCPNYVHSKRESSTGKRVAGGKHIKNLK